MQRSFHKRSFSILALQDVFKVIGPGIHSGVLKKNLETLNRFNGLKRHKETVKTVLEGVFWPLNPALKCRANEKSDFAKLLSGVGKEFKMALAKFPFSLYSSSSLERERTQMAT